MSPPIHLGELLDIYDQPFVLLNQRREVVLVNRAFETTYHLSRAHVAGLSCFSLCTRADGPCPCGKNGENCPFPDAFQGTPTHAWTKSYRDADGKERIARMQAYPLGAASGEIYVGEIITEDATQPPGEIGDSCSGPRMIGQSPAFLRVMSELGAAARSDAPVLLQGETGTGKELAASFIHNHSIRLHGPFQTLDCSALTEELFESEVFGHTRGAFTGSVGEKAGLFELADKGTLFLDEIGELTPPMQAKLLRVLESGTFRRVGSVKVRHADVRIVCATNRQLANANWFRRDLYYRVACITVCLPGLTERRSDIPLLADELLKRIGHSSGISYTLGDDARQQLQEHDYPGNIRELRNILWAAAVNSPGGEIGVEQIIAATPTRPVNAGQPTTGSMNHPLRRQTDPVAHAHADPGLHRKVPSRNSWEAEHLAMVLQRHRGNRRAVARELGVSERTVYRKLKQFGLT